MSIVNATETHWKESSPISVSPCSCFGKPCQHACWCPQPGSSGSLAAVAARQSEPLPLTLLLNSIFATLLVDLKQINVLRLKISYIRNAINPSKMIRLSGKNSTVNVLGYVLAAIGCMFFSHSSWRCDLHFMLLIILNCRSEKSTTTKVYLRPVNSFEIEVMHSYYCLCATRVILLRMSFLCSKIIRWHANREELNLGLSY